jgi:hypothetical protein
MLLALTRLAGFMLMRKPFRFEVTATDTSSPGGSLETYVSMSFGAEPVVGERRYIAVAFSGATGGVAQSVTGVTIGGIAATQVVNLGSSTAPSAVFIAEVPTGTSGSVAIQCSGTIATCGVVVARIINPGIVTGFASAAAGHVSGVVTLSLNVPECGAAMGIVASQNALTTTWAGLTELFDIDENSGEFISGAALTPSAPGTPLVITATNADTTPSALAGAAASWGP